jgi:outer membrane protein assembly factor BamB
MAEETPRKPLRLWPGLLIVVVQLLLAYVPRQLAAGSMAMFWGMMASLIGGTLLVWLWWLVFSRARWYDRLGGVALMIAGYAAAVLFSHPSAQVAIMVPGIPWLCAAFVFSLFARKRWVTVCAVLVASLGWTLVRTDGVTGDFSTSYSWRWGRTEEQRFLASDASEAPAATGGDVEIMPDSAWAGFRGAERDGVVRGLSIDTDWSSNPPRELWRRKVGPGWSSFAMVGDRICTMEQRGDDEAVVCYDANTGEPVWLYDYPARFWEVMGGLGPRATPSYSRGRLYSLGATGILNCLDAADGTLIWSRDIGRDAGAPVPQWAFSSSPLISDDLVIVHAPGAANGRSVVAYDRGTGEPRWFGPAEGQSYSSPQLGLIDGARQVIQITQLGVYGLAPGTGELLWSHAWPTTVGGDRVIQPSIVDGGSAVLVGTSFGMGTRKLAVSRDDAGNWSARELWTSRGLKPYYNDTVVHDGFAYGFDGNILSAIDVATGDRRWKGGRYGNGQMLLLAEQALLLVLSEEGELALVRASPDGFEELARMQAIEGKTWNHPIVVDGVAYVRNAEEMAAFLLPR